MNAEKIVLGTVQLGLNYGINNSTGQPSREKGFEILTCAREAGISELDTADAYGNASELLKYYFQESPRSFKVMGKFVSDSQKSFSEFFSASLKSLGVNELEGYYFHRFDDFRAFSDFEAVQKLKASGSLKKLAVSLYTDEELEYAVSHPEVDVIQLPFNLLDRNERKRELLFKAKENKKEVYIRSVFLQGLFFMEPADLPPKLQPLGQSLMDIKSLARQYKISIEQMSLNYALHKKYIDKVIIGVDSAEQLRTNLRTILPEFPRNLADKIEQIKVQDERLLNPACWGSA